MGRKKTSTKNPSTPTNDHADQADHVSISTYSSDTASVPLDRTPPLVLSPGVDGPAGSPDSVFTILHEIKTQLGAIESRMAKLESTAHIPPIQDSDIPFKIQSSTVTTDSSKTLADQVFSISEKQHRFETNEFPRIFDQLRVHKTDHEQTRELFYNFKKDVKDYLGLDTPSRLNESGLLTTDDDRDIPLSFRHVLEKITNPLDPLPNHHFQTFLTYYTKWQLYHGRGGVISLYGYVQTSPAVYDIYLAKARSQDPSFQFTKVKDNAFFFNQLIDFVFFPVGFDISAFEILIKEKRMKQFSIASAGQYAFDVNVIVQALSTQIGPLNTSDLWRVVATFVSPPPFQKFIMNRVPPSSAKFLSYLDQFAKLYDQRVAMDYEIRRSNDFQDTSASSHPSPYQQHPSPRPQTSSPPSPRKVNQLTRDSIHPLAWQQTNPCPVDQLCHNCMEVGLHLTANCPDLISSSEQRNVNAVYTSTPSNSKDTLRDFTSFDNDHTLEDNP